MRRWTRYTMPMLLTGATAYVEAPCDTPLPQLHLGTASGPVVLAPETVRALLPLLSHFAQHGVLPEQAPDAGT